MDLKLFGKCRKSLLKKVARFEILGLTYPIYDGMNIIGRDLEASIIIKNLKISKKHAIISVIGEKHYITDFKSSNGCSLKKEALVPLKFYEIHDQSRITLGDIEGTYHVETSPLAEFLDGPFLKPSTPRHIRFAPTQQTFEIPRVNYSQDETHLAATQLISDENLPQTPGNSKSTSQSKVFSLLGTTPNKPNDSKEIVFCDESLEESFKQSFTNSEKLGESIEVPCTQECFSKEPNNSFNDSSIIPATQDASFDNILQGSINKTTNPEESQDETQIENYDSDATDIEDNERGPSVHISIKNISPEPPSEQVGDSKNVLSDEEEIDLCENSEFNPEISEFDMLENSDLAPNDVNSTKASSCINELDTNINNSEAKNETYESEIENQNNKSCTIESIPETQQYEFIPATQDFENIQNQITQVNAVANENKSTVTDKEVLVPPKIITSINTQQERNNSIRDEDDVFFIGATQDIIKSNDSKTKNEQNLPKFNFKRSAEQELSNPQNPNNKNKSENIETDSKFDAATELLNIPENQEFNRRSSTPKAKQNEINKTLNDEDDKYFVGSTQDLMNNIEEIKSISPDCYSPVNDGIPEMPCFEVEMYPERYLENEDNQQKPPSQELDKLKNAEIDKNKIATSSALTEVQNVDFSAPTQLLDTKSLLGSKQSTELSVSNSKSNLSEEENGGNTSNTQNFDAETQKLDIPNKIIEHDNLIEVDTSIGINKADFSALTEKLNVSNSFSESEMFVAPTQDILNNVSHEKVSPTKSLQTANTSKDDIFLAPTQELFAGEVQKEGKNRKDSTDSNDSDIVVKKRKPQVIKETQDTQSDSESQIGYKRKKCLPIQESQPTQDLPTLSNIIRNCANDSAIMSDLEESEESMRLVFSNCSINVSGKSQNISNISKEGDTQLELNLPSQKEFIMSQNNRPSNPLAQVLNPETEEQEVEEHLGPNKYKTKRFVYDLEPTQIFEEKHDTSVEEIPDSDPEDYGEFYEMETQPIGGIGGTTPTPTKIAPKSPKKKSKKSRKSPLKPKTWGQTQIDELISNGENQLGNVQLKVHQDAGPSQLNKNGTKTSAQNLACTSPKGECLNKNSVASWETLEEDSAGTSFEVLAKEPSQHKKSDKTDKLEEKTEIPKANEEPSTSSGGKSVTSVSEVEKPVNEVILIEDTQDLLEKTKNADRKELPPPEEPVVETKRSSKRKGIMKIEPNTRKRNARASTVSKEVHENVVEPKSSRVKRVPKEITTSTKSIEDIAKVEEITEESLPNDAETLVAQKNTSESSGTKEINVVEALISTLNEIVEPRKESSTAEKSSKPGPLVENISDKPEVLSKTSRRKSTSVTIEVLTALDDIIYTKRSTIGRPKSGPNEDPKEKISTKELKENSGAKEQASTKASVTASTSAEQIPVLEQASRVTKRSTRGQSTSKEEPSIINEEIPDPPEQVQESRRSTRTQFTSKEEAAKEGTDLQVKDSRRIKVEKSTKKGGPLAPKEVSNIPKPRAKKSTKEQSTSVDLPPLPVDSKETKRSTRGHSTTKEVSNFTENTTETKRFLRGQSTSKEEPLPTRTRASSATKEVSAIPVPHRENKKTTRKQSTSTEVPDTSENVIETKRSTRGHSVSKEDVSSSKTRASSVAKEDSALPHQETKKSKRTESTLKPSSNISEFTTETRRSSRGHSISKEEQSPLETIASSVTKEVPNLPHLETRRSKKTESTSKKDSNIHEGTLETKRSTRGQSASKEEPTSKKTRAPSLQKEDVPETKKSRKGQNITRESSVTRSTRASSVTKESVESRSSRRKTLGSIAEDQNQPGTSGLNESFLVEMKPSRLSTGKTAENIETVEDTSNGKKVAKKAGRKAAVEKTANQNVAENVAQPQNTRRKTKIESSSSETETPTKKSRRNLEDQDSEASQGSTPRRDTRLKHKVVFTMLDDANLEATVGRLGGKTVDSSKDCTVLVTSKISRSLKFLVAVSLGKPIVGPDWVRACSHAHKFLDPWDFILKDSETEKKLNFSLREVIERGATTKMFDGYVFLILVNKNFEVIKSVIEACGGETVTKVPKNTQKTFMVVSYPEDKSKYSKYLKQNPPVTVVGAEAIFAGALQQKLILDEHYLQ